MAFRITDSNGGFFSCSTVALLEIAKYYNKNGEMPKTDRSGQYKLYKAGRENLIPVFFAPELRSYHEVKKIKLPDCMSIQWADYRKLPLDKLNGIIHDYFQPSVKVAGVYREYLNKYHIDLPNTVAVFYRGNDKARETETPTYGNFIKKAHEIKKRRPNIRFLVQPDEREFLEAFLLEFPDSFYFHETPYIRKNLHTCTFFTISEYLRANYAVKYFAAVCVISQCSEIITHSGNGGLWSVLYRGNANGVHQIYKNKWYV